MKEEALHAVEDVHYLRLLGHVASLVLATLWLVPKAAFTAHFVVLWWPVLELKRLSVGE